MFSRLYGCSAGSRWFGSDLERVGLVGGVDLGFAWSVVLCVDWYSIGFGCG